MRANELTGSLAGKKQCASQSTGTEAEELPSSRLAAGGHAVWGGVNWGRMVRAAANKQSGNMSCGLEHRDAAVCWIYYVCA